MCGTLIDSIELISPRCNYCSQCAVEMHPSEHAFLDLPALEAEVVSRIPVSPEAAAQVMNGEILDVPKTTREDRIQSYAKNRFIEKVDSGEFPTSVENLARQELPAINSAVDIYNALSLYTGTVCGLYDAENIQGDTLRYGLATGKESFHAIGIGAELNRAEFREGDWVLKDDHLGPDEAILASGL